MLSSEVVEGDESYEFTWVGKKASIVEANKPIRKTLRPCEEESVNWNTTKNLYIEGDNLEVLKLLQESYLGKVKMIYIDPPYNTGNDFIYNDDFKVNTEEYAKESGEYSDSGNRMFRNTDSNGRFHSDWCSMIYSRILIARNLLTNDGIIMVSIDEREYANVRKICDEIFGEKNYFGDIVWEATTQPINTGVARFGLQKKTESILMYGKNKNEVMGFNLEEIEDRLLYPHIGRYGKCRFEIIEKSDSGGYSRPSMKFKILGQYPRDGKRWQIGEEVARKLEEDGKVEIIEGIIKKAVYPEDEVGRKQYKPFWSLLRADVVGTAQNGKDELNSIMGSPIGFDTVKSISLMKKLLSYMGDNYIVLDFFSGSATTAHAVMQLNAEDGGHRKFIMVQLPEATDEKSEAYKAGYKNICEIGKERIRRAGKKIIEENRDKEGIENLDIGFRVLKLDESNMTDVYYSPDEYSQDLLARLESNIKTGRNDLDLLFSCLLEWGLPLSLPYSSERIEGYTVHNYNNGDFIACFEENIPDSVIKEIAKKQPLRAVFRDSSFANSPAKINVGEIFKLLAPDTRVKVI
ncbi:site-specific DNA-methyltransferase [Lachnoanaerobaculum saburreum]|uniref:DNA (Cytosine-5-)-methyltransferase n=1 Tax=Lachnoanaerobaculum saburreum DSM 3986 TaxID=887325 RepID=E6LPQ2_9FIRM|nr:site-specific DNA-methyltransferase [Lachnoanaerobaculum saburreum]EFU76150.1 DNA (cytosine-5-)-methyltransferase [Lachnoanaerobaculum saburreum DSM 3986]